MPSDEAMKAAIEITKILQERYQLHDVPFGGKRIIDLLDRMMAQARLDMLREVDKVLEDYGLKRLESGNKFKKGETPWGIADDLGHILRDKFEELERLAGRGK